MKKITAISVAAILTFTMTAPPIVQAAPDTDAELPFELKAPTNVAIASANLSYSPTAMLVAYSMDNGMNSFLGLDADSKDKKVKAEGHESLWINAQFDWAIDNENDWHYDTSWDEPDYDPSEDVEEQTESTKFGIWDAQVGNAHPEIVNTARIMSSGIIYADNSKDNTWWLGNDDRPGLINELEDNQYTLRRLHDDTEDQVLEIDYTEHTAYVRVRWVVTVRDKDDNGELKDTRIFSDWSRTASFGKNAPAQKIFTASDLPAPAVSALSITGEKFNGSPVASFELGVDDALAEKLTQIYCAGGSVDINVEGRISGYDKWNSIPGDWTVRPGKLRAELRSFTQPDTQIGDDIGIELRCRYHCLQNDPSTGSFAGEISSEWSEILSFGAAPEKESSSHEVSTAQPETEMTAAQPSETAQNTSSPEEVCELCGFCPQPLGICIFIWLSVIAAIITFIVWRIRRNRIENF